MKAGPLTTLRAAFGSFSTLPAGGRDVTGTAPGPGALESLPLVGIVTGALAGAAGLVFTRLLPARLVPPLVVGVRLALTGAVHLDGYLDACDALFASVDPGRRLEILKDPRHGTYALAGFACWLPLELAALEAIPRRRWPVALAAAGGIARAAAVATARSARHARQAEGGAPAVFARRPRLGAVALALTAGGLLATRAVPGGAVLSPLAWLAGRGLARFARRQLGGALTGDTYGWTIVVLETGLLACMAAGRSRR